MKFGTYLLRMGLLLSLISFCPSYGYDPMDPIGNITIKWDVLEWSGGNAYSARISIYNYQLYRQVGSPGWRYGWSWQKKDVLINDARGAEATEQGDCSKFTPRPHSCVQRPVMVDLLPGTPYNMQTQNCCKGGVLSTVGQDPSRHLSSFTVSVGNSPANSTPEFIPINHTLGLPGYSCAEPTVVRPTRSTTNGRRWTQAAMTWTVICSYSQYLAAPSPTCCVSLSSFYNETLTPCPHCSCACPRTDPESHKCIDGDDPPYLLRLPRSDAFGEVKPVVRCTQHMCPVRVHWHVKLSYKEYWRVKLTINNFNYIHNYSNWNLVIQHPNLESINQIFSFNYQPLLQYGDINDTGMFWGINYYNDMLLHAGDAGNVQTEILLRKDAGIFTFDAGWAFPRRVYFNGDECVMPPPDHFPRLPNESSSGRLYVHYLFLDVIVFLMMVLFLS